MIAGALAAVAAISIIGYVVAISLGRQPTRELLTVAIIALFASCTTAAPDPLVHIKINQKAESP